MSGTPKQWVDDLLAKGPSEWTPPIQRYVDYDGDPDVDWSAEWRRLKWHHEKETDVLFAVIRELARRVPPIQRPWRSDCGHVLDGPCDWCAIDKAAREPKP